MLEDRSISVPARLKNQSKEEGISFQMVLQLFAQEELLWKPAVFEYVESLILKGGMFIYTLTEFNSILTKDIDFLLKILYGISALISFENPSQENFTSYFLRGIVCCYLHCALLK